MTHNSHGGLERTMTLTLEIPEELAVRLGPGAARLSREALGLEAIRQGLWTEAELGHFLGLTRLALDRFLKEHGIELAYDWNDLERERKVHRDIAGA
jgi:hypothetical protein